jgi:hypothetical protein
LKQRDAASVPQRSAEKTKAKTSVAPTAPKEVTPPPLEVRAEDEDVVSVPAQEPLTEETVKEQPTKSVHDPTKSRCGLYQKR